MCTPVGDPVNFAFPSVLPLFPRALLAQLPAPHFKPLPPAEFEIVLTSVQPHGEYHPLEITSDSELVSSDFEQDPKQHFEGVCPCSTFLKIFTPTAQRVCATVLLCWSHETPSPWLC